MNKLYLVIALVATLFVSQARAESCSASSAGDDAKAAAARITQAINAIKANNMRIDERTKQEIVADMKVLRRIERAAASAMAETAGSVGAEKVAHDLASLTANMYEMVDLMMQAVLKAVDGQSGDALLKAAASKAAVVKAQAEALQAVDAEELRAGAAILERKLTAAYCR